MQGEHRVGGPGHPYVKAQGAACIVLLSAQPCSVDVQVYATIPPFLLCAYAIVGGPGRIMRALCLLCVLSSVAAGLAAIGVLWAIPSYNSAGDPLPP